MEERAILQKFCILVVFIITQGGYALNPVITTMRTADPSPHIWGGDGKIWMYCSHDPNDAVDYSRMDAYHVFSSSDLINWTDHGEVLNSKDVPWAQPGWMFAPDCGYANDTYYFYFPHLSKTGQWLVGVATSKVPQGPFTPSGFIKGTDGIDPCVFKDTDGQWYLYWGKAKVAKLKSNMTELAESPRTLNIGTAIDDGFEGIYMHKRGKYYYLSWAAYKGYYSMGTSPYGPFVYKGLLKNPPPGAQDHHAILDIQDKSYYFYHVGNYNGGTLFRRNICIDYLYYNTDGTIKEVIGTTNGVAATIIPSTTTPIINPILFNVNQNRKNSSLTIVDTKAHSRWFSIDGRFREANDKVQHPNPAPGLRIFDH